MGITVVPLITLAVSTSVVSATQPEHPLDPALAKQIQAMSSALMKDGPGWKAYADVLHNDYSRSSTGGNYQRKAEFLKGLQEWWDYGMRVQSRTVEPIAIDRSGVVAIVRSKVVETFIGPDGVALDGFAGYVTNVWVREGDSWKLLTATIEDAQRR